MPMFAALFSATPLRITTSATSLANMGAQGKNAIESDAKDREVTYVIEWGGKSGTRFVALKASKSEGRVVPLMMAPYM